MKFSTKIVAILAAVGLTGGLSVNDVAAIDARAVTKTCPAIGALPAHPDYGSGCLDTLWKTRAHGQYGKLTGPDVLLVGDSITTLCKGYFTSRVQSAGLTWGVSYWSSRPTQAAVDWVLSLSVKPLVLVMALGTNDIYDPPRMAAQIARLKAGLPNTDIRWVDVRAARPASATADLRNSRWVNSQIWAAAGISGVKWIGWFDEQPNRAKTYIDAKGVHPTDPAGCNFWGATTAPTVIGAAKAAKLKASVPR